MRRLDDGIQPAGLHEVRWDGRDESGRALPTGVYFIQMRGAGATLKERLVLTR